MNKVVIKREGNAKITTDIQAALTIIRTKKIEQDSQNK